ncbi:MAG: hypothetical protein ACRD8W_01225 [Nitrososphaeraceae archaeon]
MSNNSNNKQSIKAVVIILAALVLLTFTIDLVLFAYIHPNVQVYVAMMGSLTILMKSADLI